MSEVIHRAIVIQAMLDTAGQLMDIAEGYGLSFSCLSKEKTNGYRFFMIEPCGSKEGWDEEKRYTTAIRQFMETLENAEIEFAPVEFGRDLGRGKNKARIFK